MTMPNGEVIKESAIAIEALARPSRFPQVVALLCLAVLAYIAVYSQSRFVESLDKNSAVISELTKAVNAHEIAAGYRERKTQ